MKPATPSLAKLTPPKLPKIVERTRLYQELDRARDRPITWITAPPGMGKTTLAASYIKARKLKCLWYQVDEGDADPATLFHYLGLASQKIAPRYKQPLPHLTPEFLPGLPIFTRRFFEELFARIKGPAAVVLDNFQTLPADAPVQELLSLGLGEQPEHIRVFVVSRAEPPPAFAKIQADQKIGFVKDDVLRFTWQETTTLFSLKIEDSSNSPALPVLRQLYDQTEGWIAGLVLTIAKWQEELPGSDVQDWHTPGVVFEYLAAEVFKALPGDFQNVLLSTAFASSVSVSLACALSKDPKAGKFLADLYRRRYFIERHHNPTISYQYHPLFRDFLQKMAERAFSDIPLRQLKVDTGIGLTEEGQFEEAAGLFISEKAFDELIQLVLRIAKNFVQQGRTGVLQRWVEALPEEEVNANPWLLFWFAQCQRFSNVSKSVALFIKAFEAFREEGNHVGMVIGGTTIIECLIWGWKEWSKIDDWIEILHPIAKSRPSYPNRESEVQVTVAMCVALLWRKPTSPNLTFWLKKRASLAEQAPEILVLSPLNAFFISHFIALGAMNKVKSFFHELQCYTHGVRLPTLVKLADYFMKAHFSWFTGERASCDRAVVGGLSYAEKTGCVVMNFQISVQSVFGALLEYDTKRAMAYLEPFKPMWENDLTIGGAHFNFLLGWVKHLKGHLREARKYMEKARDLISRMDTGFPEGLILTHLASLRHAQGETEKAKELFPQIFSIVNQSRSISLQYIAKLTEGEIAIDQGEQEKGRQLIQEGFQNASSQNYKYHSWWPKEVLTKLCTNALEWDIETDYVQSVIRQYRLTPQDPTAPPSSWPWALKIHTLGRFTIEIEGTPLTAARKIPRRTLLFLKALIAFGGREVAETDISDALWPDADGDMAHQAFATTLHRVRKLLGQPNLIHQQDKKLTLNAHWCWVDAWGIEALSGKAPASIKGEDKQSEEETLKRLVALYQGPFLPDDIHEPWTAPMRERLRRKYLTALETLCTAWSQEGRKAKAKACLERAIEKEPAVENIYDVFFGKG